MKRTPTASQELLAGIFFNLFVLFTIGLALAAFFSGARFLVEKVLPWLGVAFVVATIAYILVFLPLALISLTKPVGFLGIEICSFILLSTMWTACFSYIYLFSSPWLAALGTIFFDFGVVPLAMIVAIWHGLWGHLLDILIFTLFAVCSFIGLYVLAAREHSRAAIES